MRTTSKFLLRMLMGLLGGPGIAVTLSGCAEVTLRGLTCDVQAGEAVPAADGRMVWQQQIHLRNNTNQRLEPVSVVINPVPDRPDSGYRFELPVPLEPGAHPRIALSAFRDRSGRHFPSDVYEIVTVHVETPHGVRRFPGSRAPARFYQVELIP